MCSLCEGLADALQMPIENPYAAISANVASSALGDWGQWHQLRDIFHPDARISLSWYCGSFDGFVQASKDLHRSFSSETRHWLGVPDISVRENRAIAESNAVIRERVTVGSVEVHLTSYARFLDRFEQRADGAWRILSRTAIYEKDCMDPVTTSSAAFDVLYGFAQVGTHSPQIRHLGYLAECKGIRLAERFVIANSGEEDVLRSSASEWFGGR